MANALVAMQEGLITKDTFFPCDQSKVGCHGHPPANSVAKSQYSILAILTFILSLKLVYNVVKNEVSLKIRELALIYGKRKLLLWF
jgi:hypothetical protein